MNLIIISILGFAAGYLIPKILGLLLIRCIGNHYNASFCDQKVHIFCKNKEAAIVLLSIAEHIRLKYIEEGLNDEPNAQ